jgi:hypothetical protein
MNLTNDDISKIGGSEDVIFPSIIIHHAYDDVFVMKYIDSFSIVTVRPLHTCKCLSDRLYDYQGHSILQHALVSESTGVK